MTPFEKLVLRTLYFILRVCVDTNLKIEMGHAKIDKFEALTRELREALE